MYYVTGGTIDVGRVVSGKSPVIHTVTIVTFKAQCLHPKLVHVGRVDDQLRITAFFDMGHAIAMTALATVFGVGTTAQVHAMRSLVKCFTNVLMTIHTDVVLYTVGKHHRRRQNKDRDRGRQQPHRNEPVRTTPATTTHSFSPANSCIPRETQSIAFFGGRCL